MSHRSDARVPSLASADTKPFLLAALRYSEYTRAQRQPLSLYPSASVLFHLRSVSSHSFQVAVRGFPKDNGPLLVKRILGIVNPSEQSGQQGTTRRATPPQATPALSFTPDLLASGHHLPTSPFSFNKQYFVFAGYHLPFIPTILPFCHPDRQHQRNNYQLGI